MAIGSRSGTSLYTLPIEIKFPGQDLSAGEIKNLTPQDNKVHKEDIPDGLQSELIDHYGRLNQLDQQMEMTNQMLSNGIDKYGDFKPFIDSDEGKQWLKAREYIKGQQKWTNFLISNLSDINKQVGLWDKDVMETKSAGNDFIFEGNSIYPKIDPATNQPYTYSSYSNWVKHNTHINFQKFEGGEIPVPEIPTLPQAYNLYDKDTQRPMFEQNIINQFDHMNGNGLWSANPVQVPDEIGQAIVKIKEGKSNQYEVNATADYLKGNMGEVDRKSLLNEYWKSYFANPDDFMKPDKTGKLMQMSPDAWYKQKVGEIAQRYYNNEYQLIGGDGSGSGRNDWTKKNLSYIDLIKAGGAIPTTEGTTKNIYSDEFPITLGQVRHQIVSNDNVKNYLTKNSYYSRWGDIYKNLTSENKQKIGIKDEADWIHLKIGELYKSSPDFRQLVDKAKKEIIEQETEKNPAMAAMSTKGINKVTQDVLGIEGYAGYPQMAGMGYWKKDEYDKTEGQLKGRSLFNTNFITTNGAVNNISNTGGEGRIFVETNEEKFLNIKDDKGTPGRILGVTTAIVDGETLKQMKVNKLEGNQYVPKNVTTSGDDNFHVERLSDSELSTVLHDSPGVRDQFNANKVPLSFEKGNYTTPGYKRNLYKVTIYTDIGSQLSAINNSDPNYDERPLLYGMGLQGSMKQEDENKVGTFKFPTKK